MKIVDVCAFYSERGGGVRTYIDQKLRAAEVHGHDIDIIIPAMESGTRQISNHGRIIQLEAPAFPLDRRYHWFDDEDAVHAILDAEQPDIVEASSPWKTSNIVANWSGNAKRSLYMHADPLSAYAYRWLGKIFERPTIDKQFDWFWRHLRRMNGFYDTIVCPNQNLCDRLIEGGVDRATTISMGVEQGIFSPHLRSDAVRTQMLENCELPADATLLIGVGRFSSEKRWPMVIDAVSNVAKKQAIGLAIIGGGRQEQKLISHVGPNPHIKIISHVSDREVLAKILASADALVHGCEAETFGLVAAEVQASGTPLILPDSGGAADFYAEERGEIYRGGERTSLEKAIIRFLERDQNAVKAAAMAAAPNIRTLDDHFTDLFAHYGALSKEEALTA